MNYGRFCAWPVWLQYGWAVLGALACGALGYAVGRKR